MVVAGRLLLLVNKISFSGDVLVKPSTPHAFGVVLGAA